MNFEKGGGMFRVIICLKLQKVVRLSKPFKVMLNFFINEQDNIKCTLK